MASRTPSLDSPTGANSLGSLIYQKDYHSLSNSPTTMSSLASVSSSTFSGNNTQTKWFTYNQILPNPNVMHCLHSFSKDCLECNQEHPKELDFPYCHHKSVLGSRGVTDRPTGCVIFNNIENQKINGFCTSCKNRTSAVSKCVDCKTFLCVNCTNAHKLMNFFEGHQVYFLIQEKNDKDDLTPANGEDLNCPRHKASLLKYFCRSCDVPACKECTDHQKHDCDHISVVGQKQIELMSRTVQEGKNKATDLRNIMNTLEHSAQRLKVQYHKAQNEINETFQFYCSTLEERQQDLLKELASIFSARQMALNIVGQNAKVTSDELYQVCESIELFGKCSRISECVMFKKVLDSSLQAITYYTPYTTVQQIFELEFVSNYQAIQVGVRNTFGYIRSSAEVIGTSKQPPGNECMNGNYLNGTTLNGTLDGVLERPYSNGPSSSSPTGIFQSESNIVSKRFSNANSLGPLSTSIRDLGLNGINHNEKWSSGGSDNFSNSGSEYTGSLSHENQGDPDLSSKLLLKIKRQKIMYHSKFKEFGVLEWQTTQLSGVAVNAQNDIIVADTNNHHIQIFDKEGNFKFQFGESGKEDDQLLYPYRVAVVKESGDVVITERFPTPQIQIYNQYGQFVRKFGANILQYPRGVTVDNKGRIVVVESKVMRIIIFDQAGNVLQKFGSSKHLEFPTSVAVNDKEEIFISDNRAHCVKVFNYKGVFLRQIGGIGVTNYPIGVRINAAGEILIADNHINFNITIYKQNGQLVSAFESKVKHGQCFDVALMDNGSIVLPCNDNRIYIYRYIHVPQSTCEQ